MSEGRGKIMNRAVEVLCLLVPMCSTLPVVSDVGEAESHCVLSNEQGRVDVALTGARITSWRDACGRERLFMPEQPLSGGAEWSHGGIPLCWPWFGRKDGVIHGFIRNKRFSVVRRTADELLLRYSLESKEEPSFPYKADIDVEIQLKDGLSVVLRTRNTGDKPFDFTCGIHPYFAVSDYGKLSFDGIEKDSFACVHGMDKAFPRPSNGSYRMTDEGLRQMLSLHSSGNSHIILWSPGTVEPCNRNLRPEDMTKFVGYGPAHTKAAQPLALSPGVTHEISLKMTLDSFRAEPPKTYPQKTIRFPGSGACAFDADGTTLIACSAWCREDGGVVFDISDPTNIVFAGAFKSCGYVTSSPVIIPGTSFALVPNWRSASVVDFSDKCAPRIVQSLAFDSEKRNAVEVRLVGRYILLQGDRSCHVYLWNDKTNRAEFVEAFDNDRRRFPQPPAPDPRARALPKPLCDEARVIGDYAFVVDVDRASVRAFHLLHGKAIPVCERFMTFGLPAVALKGDCAYVYSPSFRWRHRLMALDISKDGFCDFGETLVLPRNSAGECFTMGMLPVGAVTVVGNRLLFDDGHVEISSRGAFANPELRTTSAAGISVDGTRVALAQSTRIEVRDFTKSSAKAVLSSLAFTNMLHATGVALRGDVLWAVVVPKSSSNASFLNSPPPEKAYLYALDVSKREASVLSRTVISSAVSCAFARDGVLVVPGISSAVGSAHVTVVDTSNPCAPRILARAEGVIQGAAYRVKASNGDVFFNDCGCVKRLDVSDPAAPKVVRIYESNREDVYGVDDFAISDGRLCAISHGSVAVYGLEGEGAVSPSVDEDVPKWFEKPPKGVVFSYVNAAGIALPEGEACASVVGKDGTVYVAAGVPVLAAVRKNGLVLYVRHKGPRWHYFGAYGRGVDLSADEKIVYVDCGKDEGGYLAYSTEALKKAR